MVVEFFEVVLGGFRSFHVLVTTIIISIFYRNISSLKGSYLSDGGGGGMSLLFGLMVWGAKFWGCKYEESRANIFGPLFLYIVTALSPSVINDHSLKSTFSETK